MAHIIKLWLKKVKNVQIRRNRLSWYKLVIKNNPEIKQFSDYDGELQWLNKWRKWNKNVSPMAYRIFSHYIGSDINIIPYEISDAIIEPILTPVKYREMYNDKNTIGLLFPKGWFQPAYLRRINGYYYVPKKDGEENHDTGYHSISKLEAESIVNSWTSIKNNVVTKGSRTGGGEEFPYSVFVSLRGKCLISWDMN